MKTDVITIHSDLKGHDLVMETEERFASYHNITGRQAMHLRLLTEETLSMANGILDDFRGNFWMEGETTKKGLLCRICLSADKLANKEQEAHILSVSTSGRNESARGVLGMIREMVRRSLQTESIEDEQFLQNMNDAFLGMENGNAGIAAPDANYWSLQVYRQELSAQKNSKPEEWDELEKSIIATLADEVKVWLNSNSTDVIVEKYIAD